MSIRPDPEVQSSSTATALELSKSKESREQLATVWPIHMKAAERGITSALTAGPLVSFPVKLLVSSNCSFKLEQRFLFCFFKCHWCPTLSALARSRAEDDRVNGGRRRHPVRGPFAPESRNAPHGAADATGSDGRRSLHARRDGRFSPAPFRHSRSDPAGGLESGAGRVPIGRAARLLEADPNPQFRHGHLHHGILSLQVHERCGAKGSDPTNHGGRHVVKKDKITVRCFLYYYYALCVFFSLFNVQ